MVLPVIPIIPQTGVKTAPVPATVTPGTPIVAAPSFSAVSLATSPISLLAAAAGYFIGRQQGKAAVGAGVGLVVGIGVAIAGRSALYAAAKK